MKVVAVLPAKGRSERLENKNIKLLDGKPLFLHTLEKLVSCDFIDEVYLDSESEMIRDLASEVDCKFLRRDESLAGNDTDGNRLFMNEVEHIEADIYIQVLCTSPFVQVETLRRGLELLKTDTQYDSAVLIKREKQYRWNLDPLLPAYNINRIPNSVDLEDVLVETMGLYLITRDAALKVRRRIGERPFLLEAKALEAVDVNTPEEFELANLIAAGIRERERSVRSHLSKRLTSSMISDVLDELGMGEKVILDMTLNFPDRKIFGRAKTLKVRQTVKEDSSSIFDALNAYETIVPGDVIVVENELPQYAYFGELNASLAVRSGAIGAVIGGKTRDSREVKRMDFPVFSQGYSCKDIKTSGALAHFNKKITICQVEIGYEDLIFGDRDGIVVIPKAEEERVLAKCLEIVRKESSILADIVDGTDISSIRRTYGDF